MKLRDEAFIGLLSVLLFIVSWGGAQVIGGTMIYASLALILLIVLSAVAWSYRRTSRVFAVTQRQEFQQIEGLFSLFATLEIKHPLPPMRDWAVSPDFAARLVSLILRQRPERILELGSGVSTILSAYCLKSIGKGMIVALENDDHFANETSANLVSHDVAQFARILYAPLVETEINNKTWQYYRRTGLDPSAEIDMLIVDGPAGSIQPLSRYPAIPLFYKQLRPGGFVLLDDAYRKDERQILKLWQNDFKELSIKEVSTEKGCAILQKVPATL